MLASDSCKPKGANIRVSNDTVRCCCCAFLLTRNLNNLARRLHCLCHMRLLSASRCSGIDRSEAPRPFW